MMAARCQGHNPVKQIPARADDLCAPHRVIRALPAGAVSLRYHVAAIQCVIKAAPTCIGSVEGVTRVHHRYHQLRTGKVGDFGINTPRGHLDRHRLGDEVADMLKEVRVRFHILHRPGVCPVPCIHAGLQVFTSLQQRLIFGAELGHQGRQPLPEPTRRQACARQQFVLYEADQHVRHLQVPQTCRHMGHGRLQSGQGTHVGLLNLAICKT